MDDLQRSIESKLELHHKIEAVLGLSCVFLNENPPANAEVDTSRCMIEILDCQGSRSVHRQCDYEDVVVRMRHLKRVDRHAELGVSWCISFLHIAVLLSDLPPIVIAYSRCVVAGVF